MTNSEKQCIQVMDQRRNYHYYILERNNTKQFALHSHFSCLWTISSKCKLLTQHERHESENIGGHGSQCRPIINNSSGKTIIWIWSKQVLIFSSRQQRLIWRKAILRPYGYGFIMSFKAFSNRLPAYRWLSRAIEINRDALLYQSQLRRRIRLQTQKLHMGFWQRLTGIDGFFLVP